MIGVLFFVSGFASLLYQVVWQRALFAIYGVNVESATVVVTAFLLGLGLGSLAGGAVSKRPGARPLVLFAAAEGLVGLYGLVSLPVFRGVGRATLTASPVVTALVTFLLVLVPTLLMGATLPLLVTHAVAKPKVGGPTNVGRVVGALYFVNTLGAAAACFVSGLYLLGALGQQGTVQVAAALNVAAALLVLREHRRESAR